ncbi:MAG: glycosyltransferase family 4 protein [Acidobacteriota bacterium]
MSVVSGERVSLSVAMVARRVHPAHGPGGLERHVYDLVRQLAMHGVEVDLFAESPPRADRAVALAEALPEGVVVHWVPDHWLPLGNRSGTVVLDRITNYPAWSHRVGRWMRVLGGGSLAHGGWTPTGLPRSHHSTRWSVIHAHGLAGWGLTKLVPALAPMILSSHGLEEFQVPSSLKRWAYAPFRAWLRRTAAASQAVVAMDTSLAPLIEGYLDIPTSRQVIIPNAVDVVTCHRLADPEHGRELVAALGLENARPLFLSAGRVAANKGYEVMAAALSQATSQLPASWGWVLVGDGPCRRRVEGAVAAAGLSGHCRFPGLLSDRDLHSLFAVADWFVHPTLYEGSSIVTLEAMIHGLPVIASRTGGLPDKVTDGVTGYLVPAGQASALATALVSTSGAGARELGAAGQKHCQTHFSWEVVSGQYIALYERLARSSQRLAPASAPGRR